MLKLLFNGSCDNGFFKIIPRRLNCCCRYWHLDLSLRNIQGSAARIQRPLLGFGPTAFLFRNKHRRSPFIGKLFSTLRRIQRPPNRLRYSSQRNCFHSFCAIFAYRTLNERSRDNLRCGDSFVLVFSAFEFNLNLDRNRYKHPR
jgi:hypothetical protein